MQQANLKGEKKIGTKSAKVDLQVLLFVEDNIHYAFMPSFDLMGYGHTGDEAKESLKIVLDEFLRYTINKKSLLIELQRLGWKMKNKKEPMYAPQMSDLINENEQLREIINTKLYTTLNYQVKLPVLA